MAYYKKNDKEKQYIRWGVIGLVVIILFAFGKKILNAFSSGFALLGAKKKGSQLYDDNGGEVRLPFLRSVCESLHGEIHSFNQDETRIVQLLNSFASGLEVATASVYYKEAYGESLKSVVVEALDASYNPFSWIWNTKWNDLKDYVKSNLV